MADWKLTDNGVLHEPSGQLFAPTSQHALALEYQAFLNGGGTPDPLEDVFSLTARKAAAVEQINSEARRIIDGLVNRPLGDFFAERRLHEAQLADVDVSIVAGEYPILEAEVGHNGGTVAAVATNVLAEFVDERAALSTIHGLRLDYIDTANAATQASDISQLLRQLYWPPYLVSIHKAMRFVFEAQPLASIDVPQLVTLEPAPAELAAQPLSVAHS